MQTPEQMDADVEAFSKQYDAQQAAKTQQEQQASQPPSFLQRWMSTAGSIVHLPQIDAAVGAAESMYQAGKDTALGRLDRDVVAGGITGYTNIADAGVSFARSAANEARTMVSPTARWDREVGQDIASESDAAARRVHDIEQPEAPTSPIWDHARGAIMDFRDAVAVKDPTMTDSLVQGAAQLAIPFAGFSRALAGLHGFANALAAGGLTDVTALQPHDMRTADLIALGQHTEGKLGEVLRAMGPYGLNAYVNFLTDRSDESEAEGRFKNAIDGLGANLILTPLLHSAGVVLKQGMPALRYLAENAGGGPMPGGMKAQAGKIVFHGTSAPDFDQFDMSKVGTGEGNQMEGHGLYFAENPKTGKYYRDALERQNVPAGSPMDTAITAIRQTGSPRDAATSLADQAAKARDPEWRDNLLKAAELVKSGNANPKGKLLHVDIADHHLDNMLDLDKPLSEQPSIVKKLQKIGAWDPSNNEHMAMTGRDVRRSYEQRGFTPETISRMFNEAGIPGSRYLDGGSRGAGAGSRNVVLFDAKHAKIVRKE